MKKTPTHYARWIKENFKMINYKDDKIIDFLEKLSNTDSMPGGGVAASLVGAVGISAALKVCNLSLGKEKYKEHESLIKESIVSPTYAPAST